MKSQGLETPARRSAHLKFDSFRVTGRSGACQVVTKGKLCGRVHGRRH